MNEINWLDELFSVCSLPSIDILKFLWSQKEPVDTHSIAKGTHMSMEEVYHHLQSLEEQKIVKMKRGRTKNNSKRVWSPTLENFTILIKADNGNFTYKSNIKNKSTKIIDTIRDSTAVKSKLEKDNTIKPSTKIKIKHKNLDLELEGPEKFVEKYWKEIKSSVSKTSTTAKKNPIKKSSVVKKIRKTKRST